MAETKIIDYRHPEYDACYQDWEKYRATYSGGDCFIDKYLVSFSGRESPDDFLKRKCVTPVPAFAKAAVDDIKNSIFQRMADIARRGGTSAYQRAVQGQDNGVDLHGSSMDFFIGDQVLPELLVMGRVGVYVDAPDEPGNTLIEAAGHRPYIYVYRAEEILSWSYRQDRVDEYQSLLIRDYVDSCCPKTGLVTGQWKRYRCMWIDPEDKRVHVICFNEEGEQVGMHGEAGMEEIILDIDFIPFIMLELSDSLLANVANHQIALLNAESSDINFILKANFPFLTEQRDFRVQSGHLKGQFPDANGESGQEEVEVGSLHGRAYGPEMDRPDFIAPPSGPLEASMKKQQQLKEDIRQLINLSLSNIKPKMASAESKTLDERGLESGLSFIGLVLEDAERKIGQFWSAYEGSTEVPTIKYPEKYSLMSEGARDTKIKTLSTTRDSVVSNKFRRQVNKEIATLMVGHQVSVEEMDAIHAEIDAAEAYTADSTVIDLAVQGGYLDRALAAKLMGYPEGTAEKANAEAAERAAEIAASQGAAGGMAQAGARGVGDLSADPNADVKNEKDKQRLEDQIGAKGDTSRGEGK